MMEAIVVVLYLDVPTRLHQTEIDRQVLKFNLDLVQVRARIAEEIARFLRLRPGHYHLHATERRHLRGREERQQRGLNRAS